MLDAYKFTIVMSSCFDHLIIYSVLLCLYKSLYFIVYLYDMSIVIQFSFDFHLHGISFPSPHFQSVCVPWSEEGLL